MLDAMGDRRHGDIRRLAVIAARHSNHVILCEDTDRRGRQPFTARTRNPVPA
jgi:UDP-N-acetylmuramyl tripeptide synthase